MASDWDGVAEESNVWKQRVVSAMAPKAVMALGDNATAMGMFGGWCRVVLSSDACDWDNAGCFFKCLQCSKVEYSSRKRTLWLTHVPLLFLV